MPPNPGSCPYLWLASDPSLRLAHADSDHRCFVQLNAPEYRPNGEFQQSHCLTDAYVHCPRYRPPFSDKNADLSAFSKTPDKPTRSSVGVAVWIALGVIGIVAVWLLAGRFLAPQAPTPENLSAVPLSTTLLPESVVPTATLPEPPTIIPSGVVTATTTTTPRTSTSETQMAQDQIVALTAEALTTSTWTSLPPTSTPNTRAHTHGRAYSNSVTRHPNPHAVPPTPTQASPTPQQTATPTLSPTSGQARSDPRLRDLWQLGARQRTLRHLCSINRKGS